MEQKRERPNEAIPFSTGQAFPAFRGDRLPRRSRRVKARSKGARGRRPSARGRNLREPRCAHLRRRPGYYYYYYYYFFFFFVCFSITTACAAAMRAMGTRNGEQDT